MQKKEDDKYDKSPPSNDRNLDDVYKLLSRKNNTIYKYYQKKNNTKTKPKSDAR